MAIEEDQGNEIHISQSEKGSTLSIEENGLEFCEAIGFLQKMQNNPMDSDQNLSSKCSLNMIKLSTLKIPAKQPFTIRANGSEFREAVGLLQKTENDSDNNLSLNCPLNTVAPLKVPEKHMLTKIENEMKEPKRFAEENAVLTQVEDCDMCDPNAEFMENFLNEIENEAKAENASDPYLEFIKMCEKNTPKEICDSCRKKQQEDTNMQAGSSKEMKKNPKPTTSAIEDRSDIFGNDLSAKARNKISVNCPHCKKKVSAPQFVRHLCYCMGAGIRKRTRRSCTSS